MFLYFSNNHLTIECSKTPLAFTIQSLTYFHIYLTNGNPGPRVAAVVKPHWPHDPVSGDLWFVCFMRQKRVAFATHKQLWRWVLLLQIDSLLYLLWKMHFCTISKINCFSVLRSSDKNEKKSVRIKKTITTTDSVLNYICNILVLF